MLRDILNRFLFVYIDDILIFSETEEEHSQQVWMVLRHLLENHLFVKGEKCEFHASTVSLLAFVIRKGLVAPDPTKIQAVAE